MNDFLRDFSFVSCGRLFPARAFLQKFGTPVLSTNDASGKARPGLKPNPSAGTSARRKPPFPDEHNSCRRGPFTAALFMPPCRETSARDTCFLWAEAVPCPERKSNQATRREPLPGTPAVCLTYKQNSGRGEGLIYNIPAAVFQMKGDARGLAGPAKKAQIWKLARYELPA